MSLVPSLCGINSGNFNGTSINDCQRLRRIIVTGRDTLERGRATIRQRRLTVLVAAPNPTRPDADFVVRTLARRKKASAGSLRFTVDFSRYLLPGETIPMRGHDVFLDSGATIVDVDMHTLDSGAGAWATAFTVSGGSPGSVSRVRLATTTSLTGQRHDNIVIEVT